MALLDLDARRAEYEGVTHEVRLGGETYTLPAKMPMIVAEYLSDMKFTDAVAVLFGADAAPTVAALLTDDDLDAIMEDVYHLSERAAEAAEKVGPTAKAIPATGRTGARANGTRKKIAAGS